MCNGCHISQPRDLTAKRSHRTYKEISRESFVFTSWTFTCTFGENLVRKLCSHILNFHFLDEVSHKSFVFTPSAFRFWRKSRTKALFSHLPLTLFEGSFSRKLRFQIFALQIWGRSRTKASFSHLPFSPFEGRLARKKASFSYLQLSDLEGRLARKLRFHIFHFNF